MWQDTGEEYKDNGDLVKNKTKERKCFVFYI